jgi:DNA-binding transcriptional LysR family regulator
VHQLARHLPRFRELHPQLSLELGVSGPVDMVYDTFDVSILSIGRQKLEGDFIARRLACSQFIACASPAYLARRGRPEHPHDLLQHDGVLPAVSAVRRELSFRLAANPSQQVSIPTPRPALSTSHIDTIHAAALAGLGIAGLPSFVAHEALRLGTLERVLPQWRLDALTLYAAMPTRKHVPARTRVFVDFLVQTFGGEERDPWLSPDPTASAATKPKKRRPTA